MIAAVFLLLGAVLSEGKVISVTKSDELDYYLCGNGKKNLVPDTTLKLSSNAVFVHYLNFSQQHFCTLENLVNLTIIGDTSSHHQAVIQCRPASHLLQSVGGIGFFNATRLRLLNLQFTHCGGLIHNSVLRHVNNSKSSPFYIIPKQQAVLVFSHCQDLFISNVIVTQYNGFGILAVNLYGQHTIISNFTATRSSWVLSNGAMFYFFNSNLTNSSTIANVYLTGLELNQIINFLPDQYDLSKLLYLNQHEQQESSLPLVGSAGVSVIFAQSYRVDVTLNKSTSYLNTGSISGGAFVFFSSIFRNSKLNVHDFTVKENFPVGTSGSCGLLVHLACLSKRSCTTEEVESWTPLQIISSEFSSNSPYKPGPNTDDKAGQERNGAVAILQYWPIKNASIILRDVAFHNNTSNLPGSCACLCANYMFTVGEFAGQSISNGISLHLESIIATYNGGGYPTSSTAMFSFKGLEKVTFCGNSQFSHNYGSVVKARLTAVYLQDELVFENNRGLQGPVLQISELAYLVLNKPLNATFISNIAFYYGGVLYSDTTGDDSEDSRCLLQATSAVSNGNVAVSFNFINNSATKSGNTIYAYPFYNCTQYSGYADVLSLYNRLFKFSENYTQRSNGAVLNQISSRATKVCRCEYGMNRTASARCDQSAVLPVTRVYGGGIVNYSVCCIDAVDSIVYSSVIVRLYKKIRSGALRETTAVSIPSSDQARQLYENTCTVSNVTILRHNEKDEEEHITVTISLLQQQPSFQLNVTVMPCPIGFTLISGYCRCGDFLSNLSSGFVCDVNRQTISGVPTGAWLGMIDNTTLGFSRVCPFEACHSDQMMVNLSHLGDICRHYRTGVLCGSCKDDLSAVLGSYYCSACSNYYLFVLVLFAVAGIVLVVLLMVLRITVSSGTIGGLVFYANISGTSSLHFLEQDFLFLRVIISLLNLNLGFPLCLFDGMTTLHKSFLYYAFPAYLMLLLLVITLISHWSATLSKLLVHNITIQVFATLIFLSYSNLLQASLLALISVQVQLSNNHYKTVWFLDGDVDYFSFTNGHAYFVILAILTLLFIVLPYTILATIGGKMLKYRWFSLRFKPLVDAHYAPYKDKWHFWYGVRLWILLYAISVYSFTRGLQTRVIVVYMLELVVLIPFLCLQAYIRPYKNNALNLLDLFLMTVLAITTAGLTYDDDFSFQTIVSVVSSVVVVLTLMVIFGYHIYARCCGSRKCLHFNVLRRREPKLLSPPTQTMVTINSDTYESLEEMKKNESQKNKLRESLLGFVDEY